ncbi:MAG: type I pullulanase [Bacteroidales bacterium]|nr:type I pullulanase [Bacteroidales bacterium]
MTSSAISANSSFDTYPANLTMTEEMKYSQNKTQFILWAPSAEAVEVKIYANGENGDALTTISMQKKAKGTWEATLEKDQKGKFYTFRTKQNGKWLKETPGIRAKAVGINGNRGAIIDLTETNPENWNSDTRPPLNNFTDIIIYEMHHRDLSMATNSGITNKGKFMALTETGTSNEEGLPTGLDHILALGVTHLHLLPSFDFGSINEARPQDKKYNWGYDPKNYNVPEGSYSTDPYNPANRILEFKTMVQTLHKNGLRVIMDVVYNHTQDIDNSNFTLTVPGYFYRHNADGSYSNASACSNETASERPMMRQYMIESVKYWAKEYHVDGFRFDLMGIHDIETMNQIRKALDEIDPTIFIYGEGWLAGGSPLAEKEQAIKKNGQLMPRIAVFSDDIRDAIKGSWNNATSAGFIGGKSDLEESIKFGVVGATQNSQIDYSKINYSKAPYANNPTEVINYASCHDDMCLNDKLKVSSQESDNEAILKKRNKLAQTIVFTSQGVPFMLSGEELYRNKKGVHNSFESPDSINELDWNWKSIHQDIFVYYQKLIDLRKSHPAFRMNKTEDVQKNLHFLENLPSNVVGYTISNNANGDEWSKILVIYNGNNSDVHITVPEGDWQVVATDGEIELNGIKTTSDVSITVPAISTWIAHQ